jgi:hypothetical protein
VAGLVVVEAVEFILVVAGGSVLALGVVLVFGAVDAVPVRYVRTS